MAIAVTTPAVETFGFICNATSADASGCEEIKATPGAGKAIYIRHVTISSGGAIGITLGAGESGPGSVEAALLGPVTFAANETIQWNFNPCLKLPDNKSLTVDSSGAGAVLVFVQGHVK